MATQRRHVSKSKSKSLSKSNKSSSSRKHLIKSRKSGTKTRKMRGGANGSKVKAQNWKFWKKKPKPVAPAPVLSKTKASRLSSTPVFMPGISTKTESQPAFFSRMGIKNESQPAFFSRMGLSNPKPVTPLSTTTISKNVEETKYLYNPDGTRNYVGEDMRNRRKEKENQSKGKGNRFETLSPVVTTTNVSEAQKKKDIEFTKQFANQRAKNAVNQKIFASRAEMAQYAANHPEFEEGRVLYS